MDPSTSQASSPPSISAHHLPPTTPASERGSVVVPDAVCHNPDIQESDPDRPHAHEHGESEVTETVADLGLTFIPRNSAALAADQISNADFDVSPLSVAPAPHSPKLTSSASSITPSTVDLRTNTSEPDQTATPLTPVPLASVLSRGLDKALAEQHHLYEQYLHEQQAQEQQPQEQQPQEQQPQEQQLQEQQLQEQQLHEQSHLEQAHLEQEYFQRLHHQQFGQAEHLAPPPSIIHHHIPHQPTHLFEMEVNRLAERERIMSPEVKEFLADLSPDHQDFWLSQRRERLRLTAEERHKFIAHQALACNPLLTTNDMNEFCMYQQLTIFDDLRTEGARVCSTAYFDWRLDKDLWDRFVGRPTGEPSMWADDPPPLERAPYLDAYRLEVSFTPPLSPTLSPLQFVHQQNPQLHPQQSLPMPMVEEESNEEDVAQAQIQSQALAHAMQFRADLFQDAPRCQEEPASHEPAPNPSSRPPSSRRLFKSESGSDVRGPPTKQLSRAHSTTASSQRSGFRSTRRASSVLDTPTPPSRASMMHGVDMNGSVAGLGHLEGSKGMPGLFKAVNYAPVVWGQHYD